MLLQLDAVDQHLKGAPAARLTVPALVNPIGEEDDRPALVGRHPLFEIVEQSLAGIVEAGRVAADGVVVAVLLHPTERLVLIGKGQARREALLRVDIGKGKDRDLRIGRRFANRCQHRPLNIVGPAPVPDAAALVEQQGDLERQIGGESLTFCPASPPTSSETFLTRSNPSGTPFSRTVKNV